MNLCTLAQVRSYIGKSSSDTTEDGVFNALIPPASQMAQQFCNRTFQRGVHSNVRFNGKGTRAIMLGDYPIISVQGVTVFTDVIPASPDGVQSGYMFDDKSIFLIGSWQFFKGAQNVKISWTAGLTTSEVDLIPAGAPYTVTPSIGNGLSGRGDVADTTGWASIDRGVIFTVGGAALALVAANPATGQYAFAGGVYTFAAADTGRSVTISYDYVPSAVQQAVCELVLLKTRQRTNMGVKSRSLAGENVVFEDRSMPPAVKDMLWPFRKLVPIA